MAEQQIETLIREILQDMAKEGTGGIAPTPTPAQTAGSGSGATVADYPIATKHPEWIKSKTGKTFSDINITNVMNGSLTAEDLKITPSILKAQGEIATNAGRKNISRNFTRAAELTAVPDARVLEIYNALRPYRSSKQELLDIANELETKYDAKVTADYVREAAEQYAVRKKLKGDN